MFFLALYVFVLSFTVLTLIDSLKLEEETNMNLDLLNRIDTLSESLYRIVLLSETLSVEEKLEFISITSELSAAKQLAEEVSAKESLFSKLSKKGNEVAGNIKDKMPKVTVEFPNKPEEE